jgi:hypothetical protein
VSGNSRRAFDRERKRRFARGLLLRLLNTYLRDLALRARLLIAAAGAVFVPLA